MAKYPPLEVPSWGVAIMFAAFLVFTLIWEKLTHALKHYLQHHNKKGLLECLAKLEEELLAMGLISLLLPFFEGYIMLICVPAYFSQQAPGYNHKGWASDPPAAASPYGAPSPYASPYPKGAPDSSGKNTSSSYSGRHLLAAASPSADAAKDEKCGVGKTKLYPVEAIHGIHIFIALTAIVHILYACVSMALCLWRVKRWRRWEAQAVSDTPQMIVMTPAMMRGIGRSKWRHALFCLVHQFVRPVNQEMYLGLRRLLLEALKTRGGLAELPVEFPYFAFVKEQMELSFCAIIGLSPAVWFFALIQLVVPVTYRVWSVIGVCGVTITMQIITGAKLYSAATHLAARAHLEHGIESIEEVARHCLPAKKTRGLLGSRRVSREARRQQQQRAGSPGTLSEASSYDAEAAHLPTAGAAAAGHTNGRVDDSAKPGAGHGLLQGLRAVGVGVGAAGAGAAGMKSGGSAPKLQALDREHQADILRRYKTFAGRVVSKERFADLFWFRQPYLLLWCYKVAYFQSAFCLTLLFFAVWKDNQFLPEKEETAQLTAFAVVLSVNVVLSLFQSAVVAPVYALATHCADDKAVSDACRFLERTKRHAEERQIEKTAAHPVAAQADEDVEAVRHVLQKLHSTANRMAAAAASLQAGHKDPASLAHHASPRHAAAGVDKPLPSPSAGTGAAGGDGAFVPLRRTAGSAAQDEQQLSSVLRPTDTWTPQDQAAAGFGDGHGGLPRPAASGGAGAAAAGSGAAGGGADRRFFDQPGARQATLCHLDSWTRD